MQTTTFIKGAIVALTIFSTACSNRNNQQTKTANKMKKQELNVAFPTADKWVKSPLRNRIKLELNASVTEVWALVGDPSKMPAYSSGLHKVDTKTDGSGKCTGYTCYFKPAEEGGQETVHTAKMVWHEPKEGWASVDEEPNAFGLQQALTFITLEQKDSKTILNWAMHFNCENQEMLQLNISSLQQALNGEIAQQLLGRFGGKLLESYIDGK